MYILLELRTSQRVALSKLVSSTNTDDMVVAFGKYFVHYLTDFNEEEAKAKALSAYGSLGAR